MYCNPKKCHFYLLELKFLRHHISAHGIEASSSKVDKILNWPIPQNTTDVCSFLGLIRYISWFLPKLADYTCILILLTTKEAQHDFPAWSTDHQNLGDNKVFITCDTSDWQTGATLSIGTSWELARPVAFNSIRAPSGIILCMKKKLAIIHALKKWRSDLLGIPIMVYTDHRTLQNFNTQWDLSQRQL